MREQTFNVGSFLLNCAIGPNHGPPLVLLHGVTRFWRDFEPVLDALTARSRVFALDHRGHGFSSRGGRYEVRDYAADAVEFVTRHIEGPVVLAGHSLGALVAALVAAELPNRISALVLEDPPGSSLGKTIRESRYFLQFTGVRRLLETPHSPAELAAALADLPVQRPNDDAVVKFGDLRDPAALRFYANCLVQLDPRVLDAVIEGRWFDGVDWFGALPKIACPTLLLRGEPKLGGMLEAAEAERIARAIPQCRRVDLPGVGHNIHSSTPSQMLAALADFLQSVELPTSATSP